MILLFGLEADSPLRLARLALERAGAPYVFLNHADILELHLELEYAPQPRGVLAFRDLEVRVEELGAMYVRPYDFRQFSHLQDLPAQSPEWIHALRFDEAFWSLTEVAPCRVLNRPSAMQSNGSKPYQAELIRAQGFDIPETLVTNDPQAAREFWSRHGEVIYKSISGRRSIVGSLGREHEQRLEELTWCPTQFQRRVEGVDYRVHVVGERVFATRVDSTEVDYRYGKSDYVAEELPDDVSERCWNLSRALDLPLVGIDLRRTPAGGWTCFEANPSPAYSCYEACTGQPISAAIADLLVGGSAQTVELSRSTHSA